MSSWQLRLGKMMMIFNDGDVCDDVNDNSGDDDDDKQATKPFQ